MTAFAATMAREQFGDGPLFVPNGVIERRIPPPVVGVDPGPVSQKKLHQLKVAFCRRQMHGGSAIVIRCLKGHALRH